MARKAGAWVFDDSTERDTYGAAQGVQTGDTCTLAAEAGLFRFNGSTWDAEGGGTVLGDLDTTYSPEVLYLFNDDETDSSTNGHDLSIENGAAQYGTHLGKRWFVCDGATNLWLASDSGNDLDELGDITLTMHVRFLDSATNTCWLMGHGGEGASATVNWQYSTAISTTSIIWFQEGSSPLTATLAAPNKATVKSDIVLTQVRDATARTVTHYVDGIELEVDSYTSGQDPTNGVDGEFRLFGTGTGNFAQRVWARNAAVYKSALTGPQVAAIAARCKGGA